VIVPIASIERAHDSRPRAKADRFLAALRAGDFAFLATMRASLVVAHPDDETIAFGGHLPKLPNTVVVHITDGAPRDEVDARAAGCSDWRAYADLRRGELEAAMAEARIAKPRLLSLPVPDKEAAYHLTYIAEQLADVLERETTAIVLTHAYEGGHADHDATAFGVHAAAALLQKRARRAPAVVDMPFYHWRGDALVPLSFPPVPAVASVKIPLSGTALRTKRRMLAAYKSQRAFLGQFEASCERFRVAPDYDFTLPANGGAVGYPRITPSIDGARWRLLICEALTTLGLS